MKVMDVIAEILKREGIEQLFCYPTTPIIEAAAAIGIKPIICRQERVGVDMAHGFTRTRNGKPPAAFAMQYGPGAENAFPGIASAFSDSAPVLLLPLGHPRDTAQTFPMFRSTVSYAAVTKSAETLNVPTEVGAVMRRAFSNLKNGRLGPVMVEVPADVVGHELGDYAIEHQAVRRARYGADAKDVDEAAAMLLAAKAPVILAGHGVLYGEATDELRALAEMTGIPVMTTTDGKSAFPEDHALSLGCGGIVFTRAGLEMLSKADVVLAIACSLTNHRITTPQLPKGAKVIHATNDARDLNKSGVADVAVLGDARLVLAGLVEACRERLKGKARKTTAAKEIAAHREAWMARWAAKLESSEKPINPYRVIAELQRVVPADQAIVTHDSGSPRDQILPFYRSAGPRSYMGWGKSHQLGTGLGLAIGAKLAAPDKFCLNIMGDAAFGMTGLDFETAVRSGVPTCTFVLNNSTMAIEIEHMKLSHAKYNSRDLGGHYANIARDLGGWSERVEDPAQVAPAIERARRETENGRTCLIEFITSEETAFSHRLGKRD